MRHSSNNLKSWSGFAAEFGAHQSQGSRKSLTECPVGSSARLHFRAGKEWTNTYTCNGDIGWWHEMLTSLLQRVRTNGGVLVAEP
jgi:hypothetical protein